MSPGTSTAMHGAEVIAKWPKDSAGVAQALIDQHGEPDEMTDSRLIWRGRGKWKEIIAYREMWHHEFPFPHNDSVESVTQYRVPIDKIRHLVEFDGSVTVARTRGHLSATCHDEQANYLALNLAHDIATGIRTVGEAREAYVQNMVDFRAGRPTPYMDDLQFDPQATAADPGVAVTSAHELRLRSERIAR